MQEDIFLSPKQFAKRLSISRWTAYEMVYDGRVRAVKIGKLVRIPESELRRLTHFRGSGQEPAQPR